MSNSKVIGFIGTGVMGKSMALHILKAGHPLIVYNRTKDKADELISQGAIWSDSPRDVARQADIIITIVGYPSDVESVYLGENGILENAKENAVVIDMTTSSPVLAKKIYEEAKTKGIDSFDAPVSGGDIGAKDARLSIMVGGNKTAFQTIKPLLELMGTNIVYQGEAGAGQHTKMCNQIAIASNMMGVSEALAYAQKAGLNPDTVLESITSGAAGSWSLSNLVPRMIKKDYSPGFFIKHFIKDLKIALDSAKQMELRTPGLELALSLYEQLADKGEENSGTQALIKYYE